MKQLILTLSAAAFVLGTLALPASAQNEQRGARQHSCAQKCHADSASGGL
jgi:Ni/Co efflux regulator RcnB